MASDGVSAGDDAGKMSCFVAVYGIECAPLLTKCKLDGGNSSIARARTHNNGTIDCDCAVAAC